MKINRFISKIMGCINVLAMLLVVQTANSACIWIAHQPEFPKEDCKFSKNQG